MLFTEICIIKDASVFTAIVYRQTTAKRNFEQSILPKIRIVALQPVDPPRSVDNIFREASSHIP